MRTMSIDRKTLSSVGVAENDAGVVVHGELCPRFHRAVELIGRRWTGAIIQVLLPQPRRFNELLGAIPGISDRLLTERLRELEAEGIIRRDVLPGAPVRVTYQLTDCGRELREPLAAIGHWAERWIDAQP